ncbi:HD-GYP domain-containing protein [Silvibacterium sp.]|uniref:HD-GYP domain-containing protein n=1 Tax=Silvibacterium sp. TaxID=1964179 RepID=UPI0039E483FD
MKSEHPFRWRLFLVIFCRYSGIALGALFLERIAHRLPLPVWLPATLLVTFALAIAIYLTLRFNRMTRNLAASIDSRSLHFAERQEAVLRGTPLAETARAWHNALQALQDGFQERQNEARRNYASLVDLITMLACAVDERAPHMRGHSERVAFYAGEIARELKIDSAQVERIRLAALLHDIGNVGIEDAILAKENALTPEEFEMVKAHTVKGASILRPIEALNDLIPGVELHHEALDGSGYPYGLVGDEIPVMARIIAVADSFDAMTTSRPYQAAMDSRYVLQVLGRMSGSRYDADAVQALATLVKRGTIVVRNLRPVISIRNRRRVAEVV